MTRGAGEKERKESQGVTERYEQSLCEPDRVDPDTAQPQIARRAGALRQNLTDVWGRNNLRLEPAKGPQPDRQIFLLVGRCDPAENSWVVAEEGRDVGG